MVLRKRTRNNALNKLVVGVICSGIKLGTNKLYEFIKTL